MPAKQGVSAPDGALLVCPPAARGSDRRRPICREAARNSPERKKGKRERGIYNISNVRSTELLSRKWCDAVFENRNKDYGAYSIRRTAGARYRIALGIVISTFLAVSALYVGTTLYLRHLMRRNMADAKNLLDKIRPTDMPDGYKLKFESTARLAPKIVMSPDAVSGNVPEIVSSARAAQVAGIKDVINFRPTDEEIITPIEDYSNLSDTTLPLVRQKVVPTEVVRQLPEFPGGTKAFLKWLDEQVVYPRTSIDNRHEGDVIITFIVGTDGYPRDFEVKGAFDAQVNDVLHRVLRRMPRWKPGRDELGRLTPVRITVPVKFHL